jgi:hypothetical protein
MPGDGVYAAVIWNLDQKSSLSACAQYRLEQAPCTVIPPETFAQIAAVTPQAQPRPATAQGSDDGGRKAVRKNKNKKKN